MSISCDARQHRRHRARRPRSRAAALDQPSSPSIQNRRALLVAAFLHDIGKGRKENHSTVGARIARKLCPRLGLTRRRNGTRRLAHRAAPDDEQLRAFARYLRPRYHPRFRQHRAKSGAPEAAPAVDLLPISVPSARASGTAGKASCCARSITRPNRWSRAATRRCRAASASQRRRTRCASALFDWPASERRRTSSRGTIRIIGCVPTRDRQVEHAKLLRATPCDRSRNSRPTIDHRRLHRDHRTDRLRAEPSRGLLALFAGACAAAGANIAGAHITTTRDGYRARHVPAQSRIPRRRGRATPRAAHRRYDRAPADAARTGCRTCWRKRRIAAAAHPWPSPSSPRSSSTTRCPIV